MLLLLVIVTLLKRLCQVGNPFKSLRDRVPPHPTAKAFSERMSPGAQLATIETHARVILLLPTTLALGQTTNVDPSIPEDAGGEEEERGKVKPLASYKRTVKQSIRVVEPLEENLPMGHCLPLVEFKGQNWSGGHKPLQRGPTSPTVAP